MGMISTLILCAIGIILITGIGIVVIHEVKVDKLVCDKLNGTLLVSPTFDKYQEPYCLLQNGGIVELNKINLTGI